MFTTIHNVNIYLRLMTDTHLIINTSFFSHWNLYDYHNYKSNYFQNKAKRNSNEQYEKNASHLQNRVRNSFDNCNIGQTVQWFFRFDYYNCPFSFLISHSPEGFCINMNEEVYRGLLNALGCISNPMTDPNMRKQAEDYVEHFKETDDSVDYALHILTVNDPGSVYVCYSDFSSYRLRKTLLLQLFKD